MHTQINEHLIFLKNILLFKINLFFSLTIQLALSEKFGITSDN